MPELVRPAMRQRPASDIAFKRQYSVRFQHSASDQSDDPPSLAVSEHESVVESDISDHAGVSRTRQRRTKRTPRQSTCFALAHPAPQLRTKQRRLVQLRPRLLLQLQELGDKRAVPAFDVIPSGLVAGSILLPKLTERFPRMFGKKPELGHDDVLIVQSEDYDSAAPDPNPRRRSVGGASNLDHRNVLGVISAPSHGDEIGPEIDMEDGSSWIVKLMLNGSYEFTSVDIQGRVTTARWVKRSARAQRHSSSSTSDMATPPDPKWTFSIIDPSTKRHPILGTLRPHALELFDYFSTMSASSGLHPPSRPFGAALPSPPDVASQAKPPMDRRTTLVVSDEYKKLMLATGIFVALQQGGWPASSNPKFVKFNGQGHGRSSSSGPLSPSKMHAVGGESILHTHTDMTMSLNPSRAQSPIQRIDGEGCALASALPQPGAPDAPPRRTLSTGAAYMMKRRNTSETMGGSVRYERYLAIAPSPAQQHPLEEEKTSTCRLTLRHLTNWTFRRRKAQSTHDNVYLVKS